MIKDLTKEEEDLRKDLVDLSNEVDLGLALEAIRERMLRIVDCLGRGRTRQADKYMKEIEGIVVDYCCGEEVDMFSRASMSRYMKGNGRRGGKLYAQ